MATNNAATTQGFRSVSTYFCNTYAPLACDEYQNAICIGPHATLEAALASSFNQTGVVEFDSVSHQPVAIHARELRVLAA